MTNAIRALALAVGLASLSHMGRAQQAPPVVDEALIHAPVDQVWKAFTTKAGLESWMAAHAEIDLRIGGTMKTNYDMAGTVDDAEAIANTILSYEPMRMLSFSVERAPKGFPFPNAITKMWTVVYFDKQGETLTRVKSVSLGFGSDEESTKMREFFERGNTGTLEALRKRFSLKTGVRTIE